MPASTKVGLDALLTPENCVLLLIDHQPFQLVNVHSHEPTMVINNVTALAKTAKIYGIPTILTTVNEERGGMIFKQVQAVFPDADEANLACPSPGHRLKKKKENEWLRMIKRRSRSLANISRELTRDARTFLNCSMKMRKFTSLNSDL